MSHKIIMLAALLGLTGCSSFCHLGRDVGNVKADGATPIATYDVVNSQYSLFGLIPLSTGITWKDGPYVENGGGMQWFDDQCSIDDNLLSVRHACKTVGASKICCLTTQTDSAMGWSFFIVRKRIYKTSCVLAK